MADLSPDAGGKQGGGITLNRVKTIVKQDTEIKSISTEACFIIAKATELLLDDLTQRGAQVMASESRDTFDYKDIAAAVAERSGYDFLDDVVPKKVKAGVAAVRMQRNPGQEGAAAEAPAAEPGAA